MRPVRTSLLPALQFLLTLGRALPRRPNVPRRTDKGSTPTTPYTYQWRLHTGDSSHPPVPVHGDRRALALLSHACIRRPLSRSSRARTRGRFHLEGRAEGTLRGHCHSRGWLQNAALCALSSRRTRLGFVPPLESGISDRFLTQTQDVDKDWSAV